MNEWSTSILAYLRRSHRATLGVLTGAALSIGAAAAQECPDPNGSATGVNLSAGQLASSSRDFSARYVAGELTSSTCPDVIRVGYFNRAPSVNIVLSGATAGGNLRLNLRTNDDECDPVVLVRSPDGEWYNDDDSGRDIGRHWDSLIDVPTQMNGTYRVWLGHFRSGETCEGTLRVGYGQGSGDPVGTTTFSEWSSVTPDQRQFSGQPGGVMPLAVNPGPHFAAGEYHIYLANAGPNGLGPYTEIQRYTVNLGSNRLYRVDVGADDTLRIREDSTLGLHYGEPGDQQAMIYVRNTNTRTWRGICVLPSSAPATDCGDVGAPPTTFSEWNAITTDQRQFGTQPGGVIPLSVNPGPHFSAGAYDIYTADAGPNGLGPFTRITRYSVTLASNRLYRVDLGPTDTLRIREDSTLALHYGEPGEGQSMIYARNSSTRSWRAICVLPAGAPRSDCGDVGAPPATFSEWNAITTDQRQFGTQPGGVIPLSVNPGPHFAAGAYDIYTADAGPNGLGPYTRVTRYSVTLASNRLYRVDVGPTDTLSIREDSTLGLQYGEPGEGQSMIYARNSSTRSWRAICVLPAGSPFETCGGGGQTVYTEWHTVTNDQRQFATQPGGVTPMRTCDRATQTYGGDFPAGAYDFYVGNAGENGFLPVTDIRRFTVNLGSNRNYAVDLGGGSGFSISDNAAGMNMYSGPGEGYARVYYRNSSTMSWRGLCVLPSGWPISWCDIGVPNPCNGPANR
ncbi:hypothetical protein roselon_00886 [Roseibacterium elongatum DSM 19469]|uniref:Uncharacterized protein n=2 Tax=Roseicyclus elongatus TaxID=159346 RepID=W8RQE8_9RHOB|nr:hypothetical protein roselon_00886 [Roseibacterium elongatum DSM 19469]